MVTSNALTLFNDHLNKLTPYAVGFDRVFDDLSRYADNNMTSTGFPPYNIRRDGDYHFIIEMALAGFGKDDIQVEIADRTLSIRSDKKTDEPKGSFPADRDTVYRGISFRKFNRNFTIADDIVVNGAKLENGMLMIDLERIVPEEKKPRLIEVK